MPTSGASAVGSGSFHGAGAGMLSARACPFVIDEPQTDGCAQGMSRARLVSVMTVDSRLDLPVQSIETGALCHMICFYVFTLSCGESADPQHEHTKHRTAIRDLMVSYAPPGMRRSSRVIHRSCVANARAPPQGALPSVIALDC